MQKIIKGLSVIIIAGKEKGSVGNVLKVIKNRNGSVESVVVSGVNIRSKCLKRRAYNKGEVIKEECPVNVSNVAAFCKKTNKPSKISFKRLENGDKLRYLKVSGECLE